MGEMSGIAYIIANAPPEKKEQYQNALPGFTLWIMKMAMLVGVGYFVGQHDSSNIKQAQYYGGQNGKPALIAIEATGLDKVLIEDLENPGTFQSTSEYLKGLSGDQMESEAKSIEEITGLNPYHP